MMRPIAIAILIGYALAGCASDQVSEPVSAPAMPMVCTITKLQLDRFRREGAEQIGRGLNANGEIFVVYADGDGDWAAAWIRPDGTFCPVDTGTDWGRMTKNGGV